MCRILRRVVALLILLQFAGNSVIGCEVEAQGLANSPGQSERVQEPAGPVRSRQGVGQLVVEDAQSGAKFRLNLARYHVHVMLQPPVALVQIDQSFYNPLERQQEGTFVFNLPPSASVSRFAMYVTRTQLIEGELIERKRASNIYESIVRSMRDPAILEQIGDSLFKIRVFPIFAKDTKRILLDYTVPLVAEAGRYRFQLPLMSDLEPIGDFRVTGVIHGPTDVESVAVTIDPPIGLVRDQRPDGAVTFELAQRSVRHLSDLSVAFVQHSDQEITVQSYAPEPAAVGPDRRPNSPYFLATLWPGSVPGTDRVSEVKPVDMLILAETSARIRDRDGLRRTVQATVDKLRPDDRFQLGCVDVGYRPMCDGWVSPGSDGANAALNQFRDQFFLGATDLAQTFAEAVSHLGPAVAGRRRMVVFVGAGAASYGEMRPAHLSRGVADQLGQQGAVFFALLVDNDPQGWHLGESLARATGGRVFDASAGQREEPAQRELSRWLASGFPTPVKVVSVKVDGVRSEDLAFDPSWVPGRTYEICGRAERPGELELAITTEGWRSIAQTMESRCQSRWARCVRRAALGAAAIAATSRPRTSGRRRIARSDHRTFARVESPFAAHRVLGARKRKGLHALRYRAGNASSVLEAGGRAA